MARTGAGTSIPGDAHVLPPPSQPPLQPHMPPIPDPPSCREGFTRQTYLAPPAETLRHKRSRGRGLSVLPNPRAALLVRE